MTKSPVLPMPEPQHYSDYGFDPKLDYFQVLEEARRDRDSSETRSLDALHFRLRKPVLKGDSWRASENKKYSSRWWRNALLFFKRKRTADARSGGDQVGHRVAAAAPPTVAAYSSMSCPSSPYTGCRAVLGPVYWTESSDASSWTPRRIRNAAGGWGCRPSSGPLRLSETGDVEVPYLCLRDPAAKGASPTSASCPPPAVPIYLVT